MNAMQPLFDAEHIRRTLARHGFHFSKLYGQNFLVAPWVAEQMTADIDSTQAVLEIGPGFGALTSLLCERAGAVVAVEVDKKLWPLLRENLAGFQNLTLVEADALRVDLKTLLPAGYRPQLCANLPYAVTTPLLTAFMQADCFDHMTLMVQREVALRLCADPGSKAYGSFTVFTALYGRCEILFEVPPDCFIPRPQVTSSVIRLTPLRGADAPPPADRAGAERVCRAAFSQRRKTLQNALSAGLSRPRDELRPLLEQAGFDPGCRGETLSPEDYLRLGRVLAPEPGGRRVGV